MYMYVCMYIYYIILYVYVYMKHMFTCYVYVCVFVCADCQLQSDVPTYHPHTPVHLASSYYSVSVQIVNLKVLYPAAGFAGPVPEDEAKKEEENFNADVMPAFSHILSRLVSLSLSLSLARARSLCLRCRVAHALPPGLCLCLCLVAEGLTNPVT